MAQLADCHIGSVVLLLLLLPSRDCNIITGLYRPIVAELELDGLCCTKVVVDVFAVAVAVVVIVRIERGVCWFVERHEQIVVVLRPLEALTNGQR